jgi:CRP/FNR family transcriptional regulator, cyclic AMP receptor protein
MITDMYRLHSERIMTLEYRTVRERLVSFLLTTAQRFGEKTSKGIRIAVPLKHQDIASSISATRETTSRAIADLERRGQLLSEQSLITIIDEPSLRALL